MTTLTSCSASKNETWICFTFYAKKKSSFTRKTCLLIGPCPGYQWLSESKKKQQIVTKRRARAKLWTLFIQYCCTRTLNDAQQYIMRGGAKLDQPVNKFYGYTERSTILKSSRFLKEECKNGKPIHGPLFR